MNLNKIIVIIYITRFFFNLKKLEYQGMHKNLLLKKVAMLFINFFK